jgi:hypothetical protein
MTRIRNSSLTLSPPVWPVARSTDAPIVYPSHCHYPFIGHMADCRPHCDLRCMANEAKATEEEEVRSAKWREER